MKCLPRHAKFIRENKTKHLTSARPSGQCEVLLALSFQTWINLTMDAEWNPFRVIKQRAKGFFTSGDSHEVSNAFTPSVMFILLRCRVFKVLLDITGGLSQHKLEKKQKNTSKHFVQIRWSKIIFLFTSMTSSLVDCCASSRIPLTNCLLAAL